MTTSGDDLIALTRVKGLWTRIGLAILAACTSTFLYPSIWPSVWMVAYGVLQMADLHLFSQVGKVSPEKWRRGEPLRIISVVANVIIFSSLSAYNWFLGGAEGKTFAAITICCSLISVTLTMYYKKRYLFAALVPHALYLISLPVITLVTHPLVAVRPMIIVIISIVTYLIYLMIAVQKLNGSMMALTRAGAEAQSARRAAEDGNAAKSNFLAVITHEIRTPMNAVVSAVNLLRKTQLDDEQTAHLNLLDNASEVLLSLLNDVLDLSKIEAGKMSLEHAPIDLHDMIGNLDVMFAPQAQQKGLKLLTTIDADVDSHIMSDSLRLRQILFNLVSNAVKFADAGRIRLRVRKAGGNLAFDVEDEGIGIPDDQMERIFLSFEQGEAATTRRYGGTGLGLAISRRLARLMGGDISVRSVVGKGSCFSVFIPYEAPAGLSLTVNAPADREGAAPVAGDLHVLIVDDHEVNRRIVSLFIEPMGWSWTMAESGHEAIELCHSRGFDVILMDMQMPGIDGITATRQIRQMRGPNQTTPVVALTANAMDYHKKAWADAGVHDFLTKPIDPELLVTTLYNARFAPPADEVEDVA